MIREDDVLILPFFLKNRIGRGSMQRLVVALFVALDVVLDVAARCTAGTGATPAAFYLGLCRLRVVLSPPAPHDHVAGGPFFAATTTAVGGTVLLCDEENWSRTQFVVAARCSGGAGANPAAFYLGLCRLRGVLSPPAPHDHAARSEERRVGKECRSRWSPYH